MQEYPDSIESNRNRKLTIFTNEDYLTPENITELEKRVPGLKFDRDFRYKTGLKQQLATRLPLESYFIFVRNENVYESIRQYNTDYPAKEDK